MSGEEPDDNSVIAATLRVIPTTLNAVPTTMEAEASARSARVETFFSTRNLQINAVEPVTSARIFNPRPNTPRLPASIPATTDSAPAAKPQATETTNNLGVLWVAIEATTVVTTFLVGHHRTPAALEASWKYIIICSVGIAVAFLGTTVLYLAGVHAHVANPLDFTSLAAHAALLNAPVVRLAFTLIVFGYGTKAGLVPLFSWLPDAHGQAPAPVSALMSGVLLSVALSAILRLRVIAVSTLGPTFPRVLLLAIGIATLVVAAVMLLAQRDLKRLLAYSSMEHMGIMTVAAGVGGPLALSGVLLHILGHGLVKGVLFLDAGEVLRLEGTTRIARLGGLLARRPALGAILAIGLAGLLGLPPFSIFVSELTMLRAEAGAGLWWVAAVVLGVLAIILAAILAHGRTMLLGPSEQSTRSPVSLVAPLGVALGAAVWFGLVAWPLAHLLSLAAGIVA